MDEKDAVELAHWAEHELTLKSNSPTALRGAAAAKYGQDTIERALEEHHPVGPDREQLATDLERARRGIAETIESDDHER